MEGAFSMVSVSYYFPRGGITVVVRGAVDGVDVYDQELPTGYLD